MKKLLLVILTVILVSGFNHIYAQPIVELDIINQHVVGTDFYFEIQMQETGGTPLYLAGADLVLTFNSGNFSSPTLTVSDFDPSKWTLLNSNGNSTTSSFGNLGASYWSLTSPAAITSNEIILNVNSPSFGDNQTQFNQNVAKITNTPVTFGQYKISGISYTSGTMGLAWKTTGTGTKTGIASYANTTPWLQSNATLAFADFDDAPLPVELTSFTASINHNTVNLRWQTKSEVDNYGFEVERASSLKSGWKKIGFVAGYGNSNSPKDYIYEDKNPIGGSKFIYRLRQIDTEGKFEYSKIVEVELIPTTLELYQNYPNPFNPSTTISFALPQSGNVTLKVFNTLGEEVATVLNGFMQAGIHNINFDTESALGVFPTGLYIYQLTTNDTRITKKMLLMK